jgi:Na+-translocating ferredoxin:NAD+ oxidoreductase RnfG subunit
LEHPANYRGREVANTFQAQRNKLIQNKSKERAEKVPPQIYQQVMKEKAYVQSVSNPVQPSTSQKAGSSIEELLLTITRKTTRSNKKNY